MTLLAVGRETAGDVVRRNRRLEIALMTREALCRRRAELTTGVALRALQIAVRSRQREARRGVIEVVEAPGVERRGRMAHRAIAVEPVGDVVGIRGGQERVQMAGFALDGRVHESQPTLGLGGVARIAL